MLLEYVVLPERLTIYVAANSDVERENWVEHFSYILGAATCITAVGTWQGITEPVIQVEHFCASANEVFCKVLLSLVNYKKTCNQEAVSVQFNGALVVFNTEASLFNYADKIR